MELYLPVIWAAVIAVAVVLYVVLDGFDLGLGILFPFTKDERERDQMMNSVAPFWDGNETWLILGGGGLWVAFPTAYAVIMPALYLPVIAMLLALVFRGVAFEFRWVAKPDHRLWDIAFTGGSTLAAFAQGVILGGLLDGITVADRQFAGGPFDWATPFALLCGVAVVVGYALLGATWLNMRVTGALEIKARGWARGLLVAVMLFMGVISLWTPLLFERIATIWFSMPNFLYLAPVPLLALGCALIVWRGLDHGSAAAPFFGTVGLFLLGFIGLAISNFPYLVPPSLTVWDTAAAPESQVFMLIGVVALLPVILAYTAFMYWTFRGRIRPGEGYH
ncbi:cytochrome d ubiquinol oxidase subunit II [Methylobrevis albus]|uniref:Cytochrome d ubiquinol oxidase subunit II n=1 Tax=Methylobrevis albus TaxID=2793297 RepID=A0A931I3E1_9HYPH|nr:cytochrome d ubiquinol oxidase subunit II [Methylobrevis albus]MBH0238153.1 cytochrome d ubiquinol oxidase subunit II [Methylobrevis albus]